MNRKILTVLLSLIWLVNVGSVQAIEETTANLPLEMPNILKNISDDEINILSQEEMKMTVGEGAFPKIISPPAQTNG